MANLSKAGFLNNQGHSIWFNADVVSPEAPWLVFSNSLMTDHTVWDDQASYFGTRFNILRYDQRGHGRSDVPQAASFEALSDDVRALLDACGIERCVYIGLSMGVPTGLAMAGKHQDRIAAMVLVDGQSATQSTGRATWQGRIDFARANGMGAVADDTVARWFAPTFVAAGGAEKLRAAAQQMAVDGYCACAGVLQDYDFSAEATGLDVPVLLLAGANDGAMPRTVAALAESMPQGHFVEIPDAGHIPNLEQSGRFNAVLNQFLASLGLKAS